VEGELEQGKVGGRKEGRKEGRKRDWTGRLCLSPSKTWVSEGKIV